MEDDAVEQREKRAPQTGLIVAALVAVSLVAFVLQNTDSTPVTWLMFDGSAPLFIVILGSAVAGAVLSEAAGWLIRRRRRRHHRH
jgi:uncharacterized integral membrane protein